MTTKFVTPELDALALIERKYGVRVTPFENPEIAQVGIVPLILFRNNPRRIGFLVMNLSANAMYLGFTQDVGAAYGITLAAGGGFVSMNLDDDFTLPSREWWILAAGLASPLYSLSLEIYGGV